jgi:hypothetical protein
MNYCVPMLGLAAGLILVACGCSESGGAPVTRAAETSKGGERFYHAVFFTCKPGTPETEIDALIADCYNSLAKVPSVRSLHAGRRDTRMARDVNVKDYTVGLVVIFDDKAGHDLYNESAIHTDFMNNHKAYWSGVKVYDFLGK